MIEAKALSVRGATALRRGTLWRFEAAAWLRLTPDMTLLSFDYAKQCFEEPEVGEFADYSFEAGECKRTLFNAAL